MHNIKKVIPHLFTSGNLLCGCLAIVQAFNGDLVCSAYLVGIAAVLDFFDGFVARLLKVGGEFGKQLDSLADMVTFGIVPGMVMFQLLNHVCLRNDVLSGSLSFDLDTQGPPIYLLSYTGFLISIFSGVRLAKFNIDTRQSDSFIGVPTPANSILICSFPLILYFVCGYASSPVHSPFISFGHSASTTSAPLGLVLENILLNKYFLLCITVVMSFLLVAELPLFALKFKNFKFKGNEIRFIFLALCVVLLVLLKFAALPLIIVLYVLMSLVSNLLSANKQKAG